MCHFKNEDILLLHACSKLCMMFSFSCWILNEESDPRLALTLEQQSEFPIIFYSHIYTDHARQKKAKLSPA